MPRLPKPKTRKPLEKEIEKKICDYAKQLGCYVRKFTSPNQRSVPDRLIIAPGGAVGFLEIKRGGESPTKAQEHEMNLLKKQGCDVWWCDNVDVGKAFVDMLVKAGKRNIERQDFWG